MILKTDTTNTPKLQGFGVFWYHENHAIFLVCEHLFRLFGELLCKKLLEYSSYSP